MLGDRTDAGDGAEGALAESGIASSRELVREVIDRPGYAFTDREVLANLRALYELAAVVDAAKLAFITELQGRPEAVPGARAGRVAATFLTEALLVSGPQANRDVAAAAALASATPELPLMGRALIDGEVSREHVDVAVSTLRRLPKVLKKKIILESVTDELGPAGAGSEQPAGRTGADLIDEVLTGQARRLPPTTVDRLGRQIVALLDPDRAERFNADAFERRSCTIGTDFAGMGVYKLILDAATHLQVRALIARCAAPRPAGEAATESGEVVTVKDTRSATQRQADAIADLILAGGLALGANQPLTGESSSDSAEADLPAVGSTDAADRAEGAAGGETAGRLPEGVFMARPVVAAEISVVATLDQLLAAFGADDPAALAAGLARMTLAGTVGNYPGATLDPHLLARLACDSPLYRVVVDDKGAILHHGRRRRFATNSQKRVLAVRDGGCAVPGCHAPPEWCEAHHIIPWSEGGRTDIDAMVLLCGRHHTAHHAGVYAIEMRDGIPWVRIPAWQDITRPWLRNHAHDHHRLAHTTARTITTQPPLPWATDHCTDDAA